MILLWVVDCPPNFQKGFDIRLRLEMFPIFSSAREGRSAELTTPCKLSGQSTYGNAEVFVIITRDTQAPSGGARQELRQSLGAIQVIYESS